MNLYKQICSLLLILIVSTSYSQPAKKDPYYVKPYDTISAFHPNTIVRNILQDKSGNMWFASWTGIVKYDGKVFTNYMLKENLIPFHVFSLMEAKNGDLWFGTVRGGAYKYDGKSFTLYTTENGLANDLIGAFMEDKNGKIWIGTDQGVSLFDTSVSYRTNAKSNVTTISGLPLTSKKGFTNYSTVNGLCGNSVNSIIQDKTGKIWIGTRSGVSWYTSTPLNASAGSFTNFNIKEGVPFTNVRCIKEDKNGKIWIGGQDGLYRYDPTIKGDSALTKLLHNFIGYIYEDKAGNLWISCGELMISPIPNGMSLYKYDGKTFTKITERNKNGEVQIFEITEDNKGNIWFGTMTGPVKYDGKTFTEFRKK